MIKSFSDQLETALPGAHWMGGAGNAMCRLVVKLPTRPVQAILRITADPHSYAIHHWQIPSTPYPYWQWLVGGSFIKYRIFINGNLSAVGPFRPLQDGTPVVHQHDVAHLLHRGGNALAVLLRGEEKGIALHLDLTFEDGSTWQICSGPHWKMRDANDIYRPVCWEVQAIDQFFKGDPGPGEYREHIDGNKYPQGWMSADHDDSGWEAARDLGAVNGPCEMCDAPAYAITRRRPVRITTLAGGNHVIDFGQEFFGGIELCAPRGGGMIELRLAEEMHGDGHIRYQLQTGNCYQEMWRFAPRSEPLSHFGARMFRYAEVVGWQGPFTADCITGIQIAAPFDAGRSSLQCSDERLVRVWQLCKDSIAHATADVYTDCLTRERLAYEADSYVTMLTHFSTEGSSAAARRTLSYLVRHSTWPCEWRQFFIPLFYEYLLHTGDDELVRQHYEYLCEKATFHHLMEDGLIRSFPMECNPDWPPSCRDDYQLGQANAVANAFAYWDLSLLGRIAQWLGYTADAAQFAQAGETLQAGFNRELLDARTGLYIDSLNSNHSSLHANLYPLRFGMVPADRVNGCLEFIKTRGMVCSVWAAQFFLETLFAHGEDQLAVHYLLRGGSRSWMGMIECGATVTYETWPEDSGRGNSLAHPWGSGPANIIARHLFGLRPTAPGWSDFVFDPQPGGLSSGRLLLPTPRGRITASFERQQADYHFQIDADFTSETLTVPSGAGNR